MRRTELYNHLLEIARQVFDRVEIAHGDFKGGLCKVREETCLILNRGANLEVNVRIVALALSSQNLEERFLLPAIRELIERTIER